MLQRLGSLWLVVAVPFVLIGGAIYFIYFGPKIIWFQGKVELELYSLYESMTYVFHPDKAQVAVDASFLVIIKVLNPFERQPKRINLIVTKPDGKTFSGFSIIEWGLRGGGLAIIPQSPTNYFNIAGTDIDQVGTYKINGGINSGYTVKSTSFEVIQSKKGQIVSELLLKENIGEYEFITSSPAQFGRADCFSLSPSSLISEISECYIARYKLPFAAGYSHPLSKGTNVYVMTTGSPEEALNVYIKHKSEQLNQDYEVGQTSIGGTNLLKVFLGGLYYIWPSGKFLLVVKIELPDALGWDDSFTAQEDANKLLVRRYLEKYPSSYTGQ